MSGAQPSTGAPSVGGVPLDRCLPALRALEPRAQACYVYDLDALDARARRFAAAFAPLGALCAYALKANALAALLERLRERGFGADAVSLGELELAAAAGFRAPARVLNGNGRTVAEADWVAREGVALVNADLVEELDLLQAAAARAERRVRVALRVNPGVETAGHRYIATGDDEAKFGIAPSEALEAWAARARWPRLDVDGIHVHVGSQILDPVPLERSLEVALELAAGSALRGSPLGLVNLGGGFGVDYEGRGVEFPLERYAAGVLARAAGRGLAWVVEPGRWLVAPVGMLVCEVLWVKRRGARRFVVLSAGMNDLIRPALYHARHRIVALRPRPGALEPAMVVGPVCESADLFAEDAPLPPLEPGDPVALLDAGAYGAAMASTYNGRGRLAELVAEGGRLTRARAGETPADLAARTRNDTIAW